EPRGGDNAPVPPLHLANPYVPGSGPSSEATRRCTVPARVPLPAAREDRRHCPGAARGLEQEQPGVGHPRHPPPTSEGPPLPWEEAARGAGRISSGRW